jgi:hypothetical protein
MKKVLSLLFLLVLSIPLLAQNKDKDIELLRKELAFSDQIIIRTDTKADFPKPKDIKIFIRISPRLPL